MKAKKITYAVRSWKRAKECFTHEYLPETVYVVAESQAEEYRKYNKPVWVCPDSAQGNISRVSNWIIDNCPTRWLIITDDDLSHFGHWEGNKLKKLTGPPGRGTTGNLLYDGRRIGHSILGHEYHSRQRCISRIYTTIDE